jgi:hypothetical protein
MLALISALVIGFSFNMRVSTASGLSLTTVLPLGIGHLAPQLRFDNQPKKYPGGSSGPWDSAKTTGAEARSVFIAHNGSLEVLP